MSLNTQKILGIQITSDSRENILEYIYKWLNNTSEITSKQSRKHAQSLIIVTPNAEQLVLAQRHRLFADMLNRADISLPDSIGVVWASGILQQSTGNSQQVTVKERIPGVEFMEDLVRESAKRGYTIGLIGGRAGLAVKAFERLRLRYPKLEGWAMDAPEISVDRVDQTYAKAVEKQIQATHTRIVFVGLGAPKQEYLIDVLAKVVDGTVLMSVGGSFEMIAGRLKRAPLFIRLIGFEWLWRLAIEPWRWRRQRALIKFGFLVLRRS